MVRRRGATAIAFIFIGWLMGIGAARVHTATGATPVGDQWPREFKLTNATLLVYQPQVNSREGNLLDFGRRWVSSRPDLRPGDVRRDLGERRGHRWTKSRGW